MIVTMADRHSLETDGVATEDTVLPEAVPAAAVASKAQRTRLHAVAVAHYDFVWRTLRRLGLPPAAADDATQQVFMVAGRRLDDIAEGAEKAFLFRSATLVAMQARRKHGRRREQPSGDAVPDAPDSGPGPDELADRKRARALLDEALDALEDDTRAVFVLFELDGMPIAEIASLLEIPQGTCSSRLRRAREQFEAAVKRIRARRPTTGRA